MIRVALIDDDRLAPAGIRALLADQTDIVLTAVHTSLAGHLGAAVEADVILLDLLLQDGTPPARNVAALSGTGAPVLVMSVHSDHRHVWAAMQAGARGYLVKDDCPEVLSGAIRTVHGGGTAITPELAFVINMRPPLLSPVEHQVLLLRSRGHTYEAIAHRLTMDKSTVATHLRRAAEKFSRESGGAGPEPGRETAARPAGEVEVRERGTAALTAGRQKRTASWVADL